MRDYQYSRCSDSRTFSPRGTQARRWQRRYQTLPRFVKILLAVIVVSCGLAGIGQGLRNEHDQWMKQYPTDFSQLYTSSLGALWLPQQPFRVSNESHIDSRYTFLKALGGGQEGSTAIYRDATDGSKVVIKTFDSVARNDMPHRIVPAFLNLTKHWPTEIEAGLLLGGAHGENSSSYVPVRDYFILRADNSWSWAMVTPYINSGTLLNLAEIERIHSEMSTKQLDKKYRPVLLRMLQGLDTLHNAGLCHDDIKPDNIFVKSDDHWLLGDLGSVRHFQHEWHATASWTRQNQWHNCQENDLRRALKSYLWFLRSAGDNAAGFDEAFWARQQTWSRLYWNFVGHPTGLRAFLDGNTGQVVDNDITLSPISLSGVGQRLSDDTEMELHCTRVPWRFSRIW